MNDDTEMTQPPSPRAPAGSDRRQQIIEAAESHFRLYGYRKTSVSDLGKAIGVSGAYVYRFFESKQAIGEAVCSGILEQIDDAARHAATAKGSATSRLRQLFQVLIERSYDLLMHERRMHDITVEAVLNGWSSVERHKDAVRKIVAVLAEEGRTSGEFERKTPMEDVSRAITEVLLSLTHPMILERREREELVAAGSAVSEMILRSLTP
jgi:AcrR family transcriptional regulator